MKKTSVSQNKNILRTHEIILLKIHFSPRTITRRICRQPADDWGGPQRRQIGRHTSTVAKRAQCLQYIYRRAECCTSAIGVPPDWCIVMLI